MNRTIELDPQWSEKAYYNRAGIYNMRGQWDRAKADYNMAIELDSDYASAYYHRGIINLRQEDWLEAISNLERVIELQPDNERAYFNAGFAHLKLRQLNEAKDKYDRGISINPNDGKAYFNRSIVLNNMGNRSRAIADLQRAKEIFEKTGDLPSLQQVEQMLERQQPVFIPRQAL